jgi:putative transposase
MTDAGGEAPQGAGPSGPVLPEDLVEQLVAQARSAGVALTGPGGLLTGLTKHVLGTALNAEMSEHLGHEHGEPAGRSGNVRNGYSAKTVRTEVGDMRVQIPRDRQGTFEPVMVPKHARHMSGFDESVISLYAKGMTTGDIVNHLQDVYGSSVSKDLVSRVTDAVLEQMQAWQSRPSDALYPVVLVDAIHIKIREGQVHNRPVYVVMGITLDGERDVLGLWAGPAGGGEGARAWMGMLSELKNRLDGRRRRRPDRLLRRPQGPA